MKANLRKRFGAIAAAGVMAVGLTSAVPIGASADSWDAKTIVGEMGLGWNLGNSLDCKGDQWNSGLNSEIAWSNPRTTKAMFDAVKAKGFTSVRIPITWTGHIADDGTIDSAWMARVKEVVDWAINDDLYVIMNVHHEDWIPDAAHYDGESKRLTNIWSQVAEEFGDYDYHLVFEGMNEPRMIASSYEWSYEWADSSYTSEHQCYETINKLDRDFVNTVRNSSKPNNKKRALMVTQYAASSSATVQKQLDMSYDDNLIASVHAYNPYNFCMGGDNNFTASFESELNTWFNSIKAVFGDKPVVIGEFSSSDKDNTAERVKWAKSYATKAKQAGFACLLWDNNSIGGSNQSENHGYLNRNTCGWYDKTVAVVDQLIESYTGTKPEEDKPDGNTELIWQGSESGNTQYSPLSLTITSSSFDLASMVDDSFIKITYTSDELPCMALQTSKDWTVWAQVSPEKVIDGAAYFSKRALADGYAEAYKKVIGSAPSSDLADCSQFMIMNMGPSLTVTKIEYVKPAAEDESGETLLAAPSASVAAGENLDNINWTSSIKTGVGSIKVEYSGNVPPNFAVMGGEKWTWAEVKPDCFTEGFAYYNLESIERAYAEAYKKEYGSEPSSAMAEVKAFTFANRSQSDVAISKVSQTKTVKYSCDSFSATLTDNIGMNFYSNIECADVPVMNVRIGDRETLGVEGVKQSDGSYKFTLDVNAPEMADEISFSTTFKDSDGNSYNSGIVETSVKKYAEQLLASSADTKVTKLTKSMLNYGAYAQSYFDHNTKVLANESLSEADKKLTVSEIPTGIYTVEKFGNATARIGFASLVLKSGTSLKFYADLDEGVSGSQLAYRKYGSSDSYTCVPLTANGTRYSAAIEGISIEDLDSNYEVYICDGSGKQISDKITYGAQAYISSQIRTADSALSDLLLALTGYHADAKSYVG